MNDLSHTKEPWSTEYRQSVGGYAQEIFDADGKVIATAAWYAVQVSPKTIATNREQNARRIVACVNACSGIRTENLEQNKPLLDGLRHLNKLVRNAEQQRDQLLAALEALLSEHAVPSSGCRDRQAYEQARATIAAVKGGATC